MNLYVYIIIIIIHTAQDFGLHAAGVLAVVGESQTMQPFLEKCIIIGPGWDQCNYDIVV